MSSSAFKRLRTLNRDPHNLLDLCEDTTEKSSFGGKDLDLETMSKSSWATSDGNFWAIGKTCPTIPCNLYETAYNESIGFYFKGLVNHMDSIIDLPDSESENLISEIKEFNTLKDSFNQHGFLYKRGILLWGPPGSGKTVTIQQLIKLFTESSDGLAVIGTSPQIITGALRNFREIEPDRQVLVVLEDLDALIETYRESDFLNMLDGEAQLQNVVYVATTNYPEKLDKRFKDRPSRFDTIRKIDMPSDLARKTYLQAKLPEIEEMELEYYVKSSKGYSIAYLREFIVLTQCFKKTPEGAFERLDTMRKTMPDSTKLSNNDTFGFV